MARKEPVVRRSFVSSGPLEEDAHYVRRPDI